MVEIWLSGSGYTCELSRCLTAARKRRNEKKKKEKERKKKEKKNLLPGRVRVVLHMSVGCQALPQLMAVPSKQYALWENENGGAFSFWAHLLAFSTMVVMFRNALSVLLD